MKRTFEYLRKEKADEMEVEYRCGMKKYDAVKAERYENAVILPPKKFGFDNADTEEILGGVEDASGCFVESSKAVSFVGEWGGAYKGETAEQADKTAVYCGYFGGGHWGHFLVDLVPRLWYALEADENVDEYVFIDWEGESIFLQGNVLEFLMLLGIADKVVILTRPVGYRCVIVPQVSYCYRNDVYEDYPEKYYSDQYIRTFDYVVEKALAS